MKWGGSGHIPIINHLAELQLRLHHQEFTAAERLDLGEAFQISVEIIYPFSGCCVKCEFIINQINVSVPRPLISPSSHLNPPNLLQISVWVPVRTWTFSLVAAVSLCSFKVLTLWLCWLISPLYPFTQFRCLSGSLSPCWNKNNDSGLLMLLVWGEILRFGDGGLFPVEDNAKHAWSQTNWPRL